MPKQVWFSIGLVLGAVMGAGAMLVVSAKPPQVTAPIVTPEPKPVAMREPFVGYDTTPIQTIRESLRALTLTQREAVRVYEESHLKRRGILSVLTALEEERTPVHAPGGADLNGKP